MGPAALSAPAHPTFSVLSLLPLTNMRLSADHATWDGSKRERASHLKRSKQTEAEPLLSGTWPCRGTCHNHVPHQHLFDGGCVLNPDMGRLCTIGSPPALWNSTLLQPAAPVPFYLTVQCPTVPQQQLFYCKLATSQPLHRKVPTHLVDRPHVSPERGQECPLDSVPQLDRLVERGGQDVAPVGREAHLRRARAVAGGISMELKCALVGVNEEGWGQGVAPVGEGTHSGTGQGTAEQGRVACPYKCCSALLEGRWGQSWNAVRGCESTEPRKSKARRGPTATKAPHLAQPTPHIKQHGTLPFRHTTSRTTLLSLTCIV